VLNAADDPRTEGILEDTYTKLQKRASEIKDESLRRTFLENIPHHAEIQKAWEESQKS